MRLAHLARWVTVAVIAASALDLIAAAGNRVLESAIALEMSGQFPNGRIALPAGYTARRKFVDLEHSRAGCVVIRSENAGCGYCIRDDDGWRSFEAGLRQRGCRIFTLADGESPAGGPRVQLDLGSDELVYVNFAWAREARLRADPTTLIFGPRHRLIWRRLGTTGAKQLQTAEAALRAVHTPH